MTQPSESPKPETGRSKTGRSKTGKDAAAEKPHVMVPAEASKKAPPETVFCRRVERHLPVQEHLDCPYCYGKKPTVESSEHGKFCDFQKGKDPIHFGFPEDFGRHTH